MLLKMLCSHVQCRHDAKEAYTLEKALAECLPNRNAFRACGNKQVSSNTVDLIEFSLVNRCLGQSAVNRCLGQSAVHLYVFFRSHDRVSLFQTFF